MKPAKGKSNATCYRRLRKMSGRSSLEGDHLQCCTLGGVWALVATGAIAQLAIQTPPTSGRPEQTIQRIRTEDAGSRIDEVRVGGETQSIVVQPKTGAVLPAYEVRPSDPSRGTAPSTSNSDTTGARVWNVLKF